MIFSMLVELAPSQRSHGTHSRLCILREKSFKNAVGIESRLVIANVWGEGRVRSDCSRVQGCFLGFQNWWCWLHNIVNVLQASELYAGKWLKWSILCYLNFISIKRKICKNSVASSLADLPSVHCKDLQFGCLVRWWCGLDYLKQQNVYKTT